MDDYKNKKICKLAKKTFLKENTEIYKSLIIKPTHFCKKCGRVANQKLMLCKAEEL